MYSPSIAFSIFPMQEEKTFPAYIFCINFTYKFTPGILVEASKTCRKICDAILCYARALLRSTPPSFPGSSCNFIILYVIRCFMKFPPRLFYVPGFFSLNLSLFIFPYNNPDNDLKAHNKSFLLHDF